MLETTDKMQHTLGGSEDGDIIEVSQHAFPKVFTELTLKVSEGRLQTQLAADAVVSGGCVQGNNSKVRIMCAPSLHSMH